MRIIYFTADTHFGHENIIRSCRRPFDSVEAMNEHLIASWNARIRQNDNVYIIGDMFFRCHNPEDILTRLKGRKHLIIGNHDSWIKHIDCNRHFTSIDKYLETTDGRHSLTLCHYPMVTWKHAGRAFMIHGHIHNDRTSDYWPLLQKRDRVLNAGVDINDYRPVTFEELLDNNIRFKSESFQPEAQANEKE